MIRRTFAIFVLSLLAVLPAVAQQTNAAVLGELAADCLRDVPGETFVLDAPTLPSYLRSPLVEQWQSAGLRVFADTLVAYPRLHLDAPQATVTYTRSGRSRYGRSGHLVLPYSLTSAASEILRTGTCDETAQDVIARADVSRLEDPAFPETVGARPAPGWIARYAEPVLLGGAVAVSTLLFFSLRSR